MFARAPTRSLEREALAAAIDRHEELKRAAAAIPGAIATARASVRLAENQVSRAAEAVEAAKLSAPRYLVDMALGQGGEAPPSLREVRGALIDAQDKLDAAQAARLALDDYEREIGNAAFYARMKVETAVQAIFKAEASGPLLDLARKHRAVRRELIEIAQAIAFISSKADIKELPDRLGSWVCTLPQPEDLPARNVWAEWALALETDPDAAMPR